MFVDRKMKVRFVSGISGDGVRVRVLEGEKVVFQKEYAYGYNASYSRDWETAEKPFIGEILRVLIEDHLIGNDDIEYSGHYVFAGREMTPEEVQKLVDKIADEV